ncbi:MAG: hypothetical protein AAFQ29_07455 [Pseudomonadota bacterium]
MTKEYMKFDGSDFSNYEIVFVPTASNDNSPAKAKSASDRNISWSKVARACIITPLVFFVAVLSLVAAVSAIAQDRTIPKAIDWFNDDLVSGIQRGEHVHHIIGAGLGFNVDCDEEVASLTVEVIDHGDNVESEEAAQTSDH